MRELTSSPVDATAGLASENDPLFRIGWGLCLFGALTLPILVLRVGSFTISDLSFAAAAVVLAFARRSVVSTTSRSLVVALILSAAAVVLSSYQSSDLTQSLLVGTRLLYVFSIWQWCVRQVVTDWLRLEKLARAFLLGAALSSLAAVAQILAHVDIPGSLVIFGRASGFQGHPNGQGGVLAVALPMALALTFGSRRKLFAVSVVGLSVVGLILSGSVTGMLSALAGVLIVLLAGRRKLLKLAVLGITGVITAIVIQNLGRIFPGAASPLKRLADTTGNGVGDSTLASRLLTDQFAWEHIKANPFRGVGLAEADGATYDGQTLTHNLLLLGWYQGGPLLVTAILIASIAAFVAAIRSQRASFSATGTMLVAGVVAAFIFSMTGPVLYDRWFWFPLLLAISMKVRIMAQAPNRPTSIARKNL